MNNDLISREALINVKPEFMNEKVVRNTKYRTTKDRIYAKAWNACNSYWLNTIDNAPTVAVDNYAMGYQDGVRKVLSERPQGDTISRSALRKAVNTFYDSHFEGLMPTELITYAEAVDNFIDNAPTVEPEVKKVPIASVTFDTEKLKELTDDIVERIKSGEIVLQDERPKGEWKPDMDSFYCDQCGVTALEINRKWYKSNFCPSCGADMRGEDNG